MMRLASFGLNFVTAGYHFVGHRCHLGPAYLLWGVAMLIGGVGHLWPSLWQLLWMGLACVVMVVAVNEIY